MDQTPSFQVKCPSCGTFAIYSPDNKTRPFCSDRCRTTDLGGWAAEKYRFALSENHEENENPEDISNLPIDDQ